MERECSAAANSGVSERPLAAQLAELRLEAKIRTGGVVAALAQVDAVVSDFRQLEEHKQAAELRIRTARRLRDLGRAADARKQLNDVLAHDGAALLHDLAPDLAPSPPKP